MGQLIYGLLKTIGDWEIKEFYAKFERQTGEFLIIVAYPI